MMASRGGGDNPRCARSTFDAARGYVAAGLSVIPVRTDGSKAPACEGWREFSDRPPTAAELARWFDRPQPHGIGVPGGPASGNLVVLDFETRPAFLGWCAFLTDNDRQHLGRCPVVFTPSGGVHVYLRLTEPVKGMKLARTPAGKCLIETRGYGHQVVAPGSPSSVHPTGRPYTLARCGWLDALGFDPITLDTFHTLTVYAADLNEYQRPTAREVIGDRPAGLPTGDRPGDDFNARVGWADILRPCGWRPFRGCGEAAITPQNTTPKKGPVRRNIVYWTRPGKSAGISASTGFCCGSSGNDLLYVFSTSAAPFEAEMSYSRFAAYTLLNHHGDYRASTRALGLAGYGSPRPKGVRR